MVKKILVGCKVHNTVFRVFPINIKDKMLIEAPCGCAALGITYPFYFVNNEKFKEYHSIPVGVPANGLDDGFQANTEKIFNQSFSKRLLGGERKKMTTLPPEYYTVKSLNIKADEVKVGETFFIEGVEERTYEDEEEESGHRIAMVIVTRLGSDERSININKTTGKMLVDNLGDETDNWIGKEIFVSSKKDTKLGKSIVWAVVPEKPKKK